MWKRPSNKDLRRAKRERRRVRIQNRLLVQQEEEKLKEDIERDNVVNEYLRTEKI